MAAAALPTESHCQRASVQAWPIAIDRGRKATAASTNNKGHRRTTIARLKKDERPMTEKMIGRDHHRGEGDHERQDRDERKTAGKEGSKV